MPLLLLGAAFLLSSALMLLFNCLLRRRNRVASGIPMSMKPRTTASASSHHPQQQQQQFLNTKTMRVLPAADLINQYFTDANNAASGVVFFGEYHEIPWILQGQLGVLQALIGSGRPMVSMVMEMFNYDQQILLDKFITGQYSMQQLQQEYQRTGTEGFNIQGHYGRLLELAQRHRAVVRVLAGFIPRPLASRFYRAAANQDVEEEERILGELEGRNGSYWAEMVRIYRQYPGTVAHYRHFAALISGGDDDDDSSLPREQWRYGALFKAQLLKDASMAAVIQQEMARYNNENNNCAAAVYAVCGSGHSDYRDAVPERVGSSLQHLVISAKTEQFIRNTCAGQLAAVCDAILPVPSEDDFK